MMNNLSKFIGLFHDLQEQAKQADWRQTSHWLLKTLVSLPYCRLEYKVFVRSLQEPLPSATPRQPVTLRLATQADLARFRCLVPPSELRRFSRRLACGRYCFLALDGENLAAYAWATPQVEFEVDNLVMQLQRGDVYVDDAYTVPAYRRQRLQAAVHLYRLGHMKDLGFQRAVAIVEENNAASLQLMRGLGYQEEDHLCFRRILWKRTYHYRQGRF